MSVGSRQWAVDTTKNILAERHSYFLFPNSLNCIKLFFLKKKPYGYLVILLLVILLIIKNFTCDNNSSNLVANEQDYRDTTDLVLTRHVKCRMGCRQITINEIKQILSRGKLNKAKSKIGTKGDQTYALEGYSSDAQHIRVVVAPKENGLVIITCIDLEKEWPCNCDY